MLLRIVAILFPMFAITALGFWVGRRSRPDLSHANQLNMDVFVPALVFAAMVSKDFRLTEYLPLAVLAFGETALAPAVVMFLVSNLLHFSFGAWLLDHRTRLLTLWRSPVILATLAGLAVGLAGVTVWPPLLMSVKMVGDISIPLMLFALGARLADSKITAVGVGLLGAALRPIVGLGLAWAVLQVLDLPAREQALVLVFGALPPAVLNYMFAERYQQEPDKVASMVLIGNVAAVVFLPIALALALD